MAQEKKKKKKKAKEDGLFSETWDALSRYFLSDKPKTPTAQQISRLNNLIRTGSSPYPWAQIPPNLRRRMGGLLGG